MLTPKEIKFKHGLNICETAAAKHIAMAATNGRHKKNPSSKPMLCWSSKHAMPTKLGPCTPKIYAAFNNSVVSCGYSARYAAIIPTI